MPMMMAVRGIVTKDAPVVLLENKMMNKCQVVADNVSIRVLPDFLANFSGALAALDIRFPIDNFFNRDTS